MFALHPMHAVRRRPFREVCDHRYPKLARSMFEGSALTPSASFILPVSDLHHGLRERIHAVLDVIPELTSDFEVLIVDHSRFTDVQDEALDLVREFPQVDLITRAGATVFDAIESGIEHTRGDIIFVHDHSLPLGVSALKNLWAMRDDEDLVMAQSRSNDQKAPMFVEFASRDSDLQNRTSIQMIRRCAIPATLPREAPESSETVDRLTRTDLRDDPEMTRLPKLLSRLRRLANR